MRFWYFLNMAYNTGSGEPVKMYMLIRIFVSHVHKEYTSLKTQIIIKTWELEGFISH